MAKKAEGFRVDTKNKVLVLYTNVERPEAEETAIKMYIAGGYAVKFEEKKPALTLAKMRKELQADENALKAFNDAYNKKDDKKAFFNACKIYTEWAKKNKKK